MLRVSLTGREIFTKIYRAYTIGSNRVPVVPRVGHRSVGTTPTDGDSGVRGSECVILNARLLEREIERRWCLLNVFRT